MCLGHKFFGFQSCTNLSFPASLAVTTAAGSGVARPGRAVPAEPPAAIPHVSPHIPPWRGCRGSAGSAPPAPHPRACRPSAPAGHGRTCHSPAPRAGTGTGGPGGLSPGHRSVCGQREPGAAPPSTMARPDEAPGCGSAAGAGWLRARLPHSPGTGRGRGLDGADAEPVGRVLQRLQRLLVGLVIILHVGDAGGPRRLRVWGGGGWRGCEDGLCGAAAARLTRAERWGGESSAGEGRGARGRREERPAPSILPPARPGRCAVPRPPRLLPRAPFPRGAEGQGSALPGNGSSVMAGGNLWRSPRPTPGQGRGTTQSSSRRNALGWVWNVCREGDSTAPLASCCSRALPR